MHRQPAPSTGEPQVGEHGQHPSMALPVGFDVETPRADFQAVAATASAAIPTVRSGTD